MKGRRMKWIEATGGPVVLIARDDVPLWTGHEGDYDRACEVAVKGVQRVFEISDYIEVYDAAGNLIRKETGGGIERTDYVYDAADRLVSETFDPSRLARKTSYTYDANDNVVEVRYTAANTPRVETIEFEYNPDDELIRKKVKNGDNDLITTYDVDDRGLVVKITDPRGNEPGANPADYTTDLRYDAAYRLVEARAPPVTIEKMGAEPTTARPTVRFGYDGSGQRTHEVDAEGRTTVYAFDKAGRLTSVTHPQYTPPGGSALTPRETYEYDAAGRPIRYTNARGRTWTTEYDALGNRVRVTEPGPDGEPGGRWVYEYDLVGEMLAQVDPTGARTEFTYDDLGRQITATVIERKPTTTAIVTRMEYDDADNLIKEIGPSSRTTTYEVNAAGEVTAETDPLGATTRYAYDLLGREVRETDPLGNATVTEYDLAGRAVAVTDLDANGSIIRTVRFGYDAAGNLTSETSGEGHVTRRTYDASNALVKLVEPVTDDRSITTTYGYDATGARTRVTDGRGNTTWTTYNGLGLVEKVIEPPTAAHPEEADRTWTSVYDAGGNLVTAIAPGGVRVDREFDHLDRVVREVGSGASVPTPERTYAYDLMGRETAIGDYTLEYNDRGLVTKISKGGNQVAAFAYDALGNPTQRVDGTGTATFTWDNDDRLRTVVEPVTGRTFTYDYDRDDRLTTLTSANPANRQTFEYDPVDRLIRQTLTNGSGAQIARITYEWDKDDNLVAKTTEGLAGAGRNAYGYEKSGRLISWTGPDGNTTTYEWDDAGNRIRAGNKTFVYDERNRLLRGDGVEYTYTPRGTVATETKDGVTRNLVFDAFDRLVSDGDITYTYDALGRIASRSKGGETEHYSYSGLENDIAVVTDGSGAVKARYGRDPDGVLLGLKEGDDPAVGVLSDQHDDVVATYSAAGLVDSTAYSPFGEVVARTGTARRMGFQGEYTDPDTGKVNMLARWYVPGTGGFASRDTADLDPDPSIQLNRYAYANGNPLAYTDPSGNCPFCIPLAIAALRVAAQMALRQVVQRAAVQAGRAVVQRAVQQAGQRAAQQAARAAGKAGQQAAKKTTQNAAKNATRQATKRAGNNASRANKATKAQRSSKASKSSRAKQQRSARAKNQKAKQPKSPKAKKPKLPKVKAKTRAPKGSKAKPSKAKPSRSKTNTKKNNQKKNTTKDSGKGNKANTKSTGTKSNSSKSTTKDRLKEELVFESLSDIGSDLGWSGGAPAGGFGPASLGGIDPCGSLRSCAKEVVESVLDDVQDKVINDLIDQVVPEVPVDYSPGGNCRPGGANSFVPGTPVLMADGTTKPIEEVKLGDHVLATDPVTGVVEAKPVTTLITGEGTKHLVDITIDTDGPEGDATDTLTATADHPFWVPDLREWLPAERLAPGMWLRTAAGTYVQITAVAKRTAAQRVHNLTVDDLHTYHVVAGGQAVLVHNSNDPCRQNLQPGNSAAAARGREIHNGPEWQEFLRSRNYKPGHEVSERSIPDAFTPKGAPVELKPDTKSGIKAGTRQLRRYMKDMDVKYGELWTYCETPDGGVEFHLRAIPDGPRRWKRF